MGNQKKKNILFLCTGNSCRSQMAEGWGKHLWGDKYNFFSAGIKTHGLNSISVKVMGEVGVDISSYKSKNLSDLSNTSFDYVFTLCGHANETCPIFPGKTKKFHVGFDDPPKLTEGMDDENEVFKVYRKVRDEIKEFVANIENYMKGENCE